MKTSTPSTLALLTALSGLSGIIAVSVARPALADSGFPCESGRLVSAGDRMGEVRVKCGEPDFVSHTTERRKEKVKVRRVEGCQWVDVTEEREVDVTIEEWTYDMGPNRFVGHIRFENAKMTGATTGDYGTKRKDNDR